jgi:biopolymer transport protein ExbB
MKKALAHLSCTLVVCFALFLMLSDGLAQQNAAEANPPVEAHTILQTITGGGPLILIIWLAIFGTSVVMVTFIIQLFLALRDEQLAPRALLESLQATIRAGNYQEAWEICRANKAYIARVLKGALERIGRGKEAVETALIEHGQREAQLLRTKNSYLSVVGVVAPMIGLLGTVIGMMGAFAVLGTSGVSEPRALSLRIGEVLMATASGLFIASPAFIFYYYFRNRSTIVLVNADDKLNYLIEDIPFEELSGIKIGENFDPGAGAPIGHSRKVSISLTTHCPLCNGTIQPGQNPCPHCGAALEWA